MGCWRKITVDDMLPVDKDDTILLPSLPIKHSKSTETINPPSEPPPKSPAEKKSKSKGKGDKKGKDKKAVKEEPKETVQIWPYILSKALLKLASLTWNDQHEIIDFDIIHCFTGWIAEKIDVRGSKATMENKQKFRVIIYFRINDFGQMGDLHTIFRPLCVG